MLGPHTHTPAPTARGWRTPTARPSGRAVGGGTAPDLRRPSQWWKAPPPGTPFRHPHSEQRRPARAHAVKPVLGPHARTDRTRDPRVAEPWLPAAEDGQSGEGQRLTPGAPHNGGRQPPWGHPSATPTASNAGPQGRTLWDRCWVPTPAPTAPGTPGRGTLAARFRGRAAGRGTAPDTRRPSQRWEAAPLGTPFCHPHSEQRRPARAHAVGPVLGPHARTDRTREPRVAEPWLPAPEDGRPGEGQRLTPGAPHNGGRPVPPGTPPHHPRGTQPPQGMQAKGIVLGPHTHTPAPTARGWRTPTARPAGGQSGEGQRLTSDAPHNGGRPPPRGRPSATPTASNAGSQGRTLWGRCWVPTPAPTSPGTPGRGTLAARSRGRAAGEGTAPDTRRPSQGWQAPPPGTPLRHPHSEQRRPARAHAVGQVPGPHGRTDRTRDTRVAEPWLPAPEDGRPGQGQRLTPGAPRYGGRPPCQGRPLTNPAARSPHRACRPRGQCWAPTPAHPRPQHVGGGPQQPAQWAGSQGRDSA